MHQTYNQPKSLNNIINQLLCRYVYGNPNHKL